MDLSTTYMGFALPHPLVPGASPLVDATRSDLGGVITSSDIANLPLLNRTFANLSIVMPEARQAGLSTVSQVAVSCAPTSTLHPSANQDASPTRRASSSKTGR